MEDNKVATATTQTGPIKDKTKKWLWITIAILGAMVIARPSGGLPHDQQVTSVPAPSPVVAAAPAPVQAQQPVPAPVAPVDQVLAYTNRDYEVGYGDGQIPPGRYLCDGDTSGFEYSMWTTYSDSGKQHILDVGSVTDGRRYMTVDKKAKLVSLVGDAVWIKG